MKNTLTKASIVLCLLATSANAFDIKLTYSQQGDASRYHEGTASTYSMTATNNVGLSIGHYKNTNHEGFGFGWTLGASFPTSMDFRDGGTAEIGIAPGYSITKELALKVDLGFGTRQGVAIDDTSIESQAIGGVYYGASVEYVFVDHLVVGGSLHNWVYGTDAEVLVPEVSVAYRF